MRACVSAASRAARWNASPSFSLSARVRSNSDGTRSTIGNPLANQIPNGLVVHKPTPTGSALGDQPVIASGVIVHLPGCQVRDVQLKEISDASAKPLAHRIWRNVMPTRSHSRSNPGNCELRIPHPEVEQMGGIPCCTDVAKPLRVGTSCQSCLESKIGPLFHKFVKALQHHTTGFNRHFIRIKSTQPLGDDVRIHESHHAQRVGEKSTRSGGFPGSVDSTKNHSTRVRWRSWPWFSHDEQDTVSHIPMPHRVTVTRM
jgi:hypothetical protein